KELPWTLGNGPRPSPSRPRNNHPQQCGYRLVTVSPYQALPARIELPRERHRMTTRSHSKRSTRPWIRAFALLACPVAALPAAGEEGRYDELWSLIELYTGQPDAIVESVKLRGRLQLD